MHRRPALGTIAGMTDDLLTIDEAARIARVSRETIRYWIKTKRLATVPIRISERSGKPYGKLVPRSALMTASPTGKLQQLQESHPGKLLTVGQIASTLRVTRDVVYTMINRFNLEKHYLDGWQYVVDAEELWQKMREDYIYWYLTLRK